MKLMDWFCGHGFLNYEILDEEEGLLRIRITDWERYGTSLPCCYYSYKTSGFFFFPLPVGRRLTALGAESGRRMFSELDAIMDLWLHTIYRDPEVLGSGRMPVVYFPDMRGSPLLSCSYLALCWGWSKSAVGRFLIRLDGRKLTRRIRFQSSCGSVISVPGYPAGQAVRCQDMVCGDAQPRIPAEHH